MAGKHAGHRRRVKAQGLRPVTMGSLSSHGRASGFWSPPTKCTGSCLACGVSKKDCEVCLAITHLGTFDDFVNIKSNDEQITKQVQQARQLLSKKASATCARFRRYKTSEGMIVLDDDRIDLVQRRIASADVNKILMGHAMVCEIAWVKNTRDQLRTSGDENPASMLAEHYDLCVQSEKLMEEPIAKMPKATH